MSKDQQVKDLEIKIKKLEKVIATQKKLIEILKTLPGNKNVKKKRKGDQKKDGLSKRAQGKSGAMVNTSATRESENSSCGIEFNTENATIMEDASENKN